MKAVSELKSILGVLNKARLDCFSQILTALLIVKREPKQDRGCFEGRAKKKSLYQRIKNFLKDSKAFCETLWKRLY